MKTRKDAKEMQEPHQHLSEGTKENNKMFVITSGIRIDI
jgi:hypothetical protein